MIYLLNSLTRKKEVFKPLRRNEVRIYTCGPTVYDEPHVGHGRTYAVWDTFHRWLRYTGYDTYVVMNITDVGHLYGDMDFGEDKIVKRALEKKMEPMVLVEQMTQAFFDAMNQINVLKPDLIPRASCHIPEMIEVIKRIIANGFAYVANGSVYFDIEAYMKKYPYPEFINMKLEDLDKVHRIPENPEKKNKWDFALWKRADPGHILQWPSPWGYGYPGWHIECTVMSVKYLGEEFDIHEGGEDHLFPHHPNERAQAFAAFGKGMARYWLHASHVLLHGEKMSKSTGNFIYLKEAIKEWGGQVFRFWVAKAHYRTHVNYTEEAMESAKNGLESLLLFVQDLEEAEGGKWNDENFDAFVKKFRDAMNDDINTPVALSALFDIRNRYYEKALFSKVKKEEIERIYNKVVEFGSILGLNLEARTEKERIIRKRAREILKILVDVREDLRKRKLYELSDEIRARLEELGIKVMDTPEGPKIRVS